jgi:predicted permease
MFGRKRKLDDFSAEIEAHVQLEAEHLQEQGLLEEDARTAAHRAFGNITRAKEYFYESGRWLWLDHLFQDVRFGLRMLARTPGFAIVAVLTVALGIGANTAIFSLIDAVLLRSLPVRDPQKLVVFQWTAHKSPNTKGHYSYMSCPAANPGGAAKYGCWFSYPMFLQFRSLQHAFTNVTALCGNVGLSLRGNGPASFVQAEMVSRDFFDALGVGAALGRTFVPSDDIPGAPPVAVLSYGFWQSAFGGEREAVGRTLWLNSVPVTIVGVAAKEFPSLDPGTLRQIWLPLSLSPKTGMELFGNISGTHPSLEAGDDVWWVYIVARLKRGVTLAQAQAAADSLFHNDALDESKHFFREEDAPHLVLMPAAQAMSGLREQFSTPLTILMAAVGLVLLVSCANVAGLMLVRSAARQRELAVRLALGAGPARIAGQLLTESLVLAAAGGVSGVLFAYWSVQSLVTFMSRGGFWPSHLAARLDLRILAFTTAISLLSGTLFGLAPAWRSLQLDLTPALKTNPASVARGTSRCRWLNLADSLVIAQVALAVLVLAGAGLLVRTLKKLKSIDPGFDTNNILLFKLDPSLNGYTSAQSHSLYSQLLQRIEAVPGVVSATYSFDDLLSGNSWTTSFAIEGELQNAQHATLGLAAGPKFFETMGIPLMAGRVFTPQDFSLPPDSQWRPAVINESFARSFFKDQNPIGRRISGVGHQGTSHEIVGVVGDTKFRTLRSEIAPTLFIPAGGGEAVFEVRTAVDPRTIIPAVRSTVSQLDNNLPMLSIKTESDQIERSLFQERLIARLSSFFGGLSLLLACVGLYGLLSYEVTSRRREIGVRMALGARPPDILRLVVSQGVGLSAGGAILGILAALGATRFLASLLYGVHPFDPLTYATVAVILGVVALVACFLPARRAMRVDPIVTLRYE